MPEGDVLRRTAATLDAALAGRALVRAELRWPDAAGIDLTGRTVLGTRAYGKHLLTRFDDGRTLHTHLRMDGSWRTYRGRRAPGEADPFVRALLAGPEAVALGIRLGMLDVLRTVDEHTVIGHLGPDVLDDDFPVERLPEVLARWAQDPRPTAEVLLDQTVQAGFGTIWTAEALFARRLWPWTPARDVPDPATLVMTGRELMSRSIPRPRPSRVHGREGLPCERCGSPVACGTARKPPMERPVFYCPVCQTAR
ncbi:Fpg/Nei family DNA glycosylase [Actinotalea sp. M2MS4P-6]|uniref:DNA-formamidopyrimidine glycosylase family protein n=1 Tax=Actinotalea sp. M2MS4P-6 TaxID=2983762 RepID=UPI0021E46E98|nr:DNA-formamidopyrimidine glycosylase family protein [Actinotalea sp. M2MS4P-6]MCV2396147.1 Fpg/Nei family DNA glycosylase [Actinotalea sp. M2MS4P-6]